MGVTLYAVKAVRNNTKNWIFKSENTVGRNFPIWTEGKTVKRWQLGQFLDFLDVSMQIILGMDKIEKMVKGFQYDINYFMSCGY